MHVMIIDKCYFDRYFLGRQVELIYTYSSVAEFSSGREALEYLRALNSSAQNSFPNLIIVDVNILRHQGDSFLEQLQGLLHACKPLLEPHVVATGSAQHLERFQKDPASSALNGFIAKPAEIDHLKTVVAACKHP